MIWRRAGQASRGSTAVHQVNESPTREDVEVGGPVGVWVRVAEAHRVRANRGHDALLAVEATNGAPRPVEPHPIRRTAVVSRNQDRIGAAREIAPGGDRRAERRIEAQQHRQRDRLRQQAQSDFERDQE